MLEEDDPLETAKRELLEETGCTAQAWTALGNVVVHGNYGGGRAYFFLATGCQQVQAPDSGDLEAQDVLWLPVEKVYALFQQGEFQQMGATAALGLAFAKLSQMGLLPKITGDEGTNE
jgi:ADP-ribose pyrophosphatase